MRNGFLIIGLTGPIGSGCSTVAELLSTELSNYVAEVRENKIRSLDVAIGKYYRYLRKTQDDYEQTLTNHNNYKKELLLDPEEFLKGITEFEMNTEILQEKHRKDLNRKLRNLILQRDILKVFAKNIWGLFKKISMSDLIIKVCIESAVSEDKKMSKDLQKYNKIPQVIKDRFVSFANDKKDILEQYNTIIEGKKYDELSINTCRRIDEMFSEIHELKKYIYSLDTNQEHWLQDLGDNLRATGNPFIEYNLGKYENLSIIAFEANKYIKYMRRRLDDNKKNYFVVDSFRNPEEVYFFRKRYGSFYLLSLYANKNIRKKRKKIDGKRESRDRGDRNQPEDLHKQNVSGCVLIADYSINNDIDEKSLENLKLKIARFLVLIERPGWITPTTEEVFMNLAYGLSLRSTCLSRQVGAVITNEDGFIIGAGWNDVGSGQLGCSTRCKADYSNYSGDDSLLSVWGKKYKDFKDAGLLDEYDEEDYFCFKDVQSELIISNKVKKILESDEKMKKEMGKEKYIKLIDLLKEKLSIKRLEYARALHAEENAILQVAKNGGMGIAGGTIYTTTFPCELCAKKIYQSGIKRIVYTEPYPDSISENIFLKDGVRHITIEQFEGVKSNSYFRFFKSPLDRKDMQRINDRYYHD